MRWAESNFCNTTWGLPECWLYELFADFNPAWSILFKPLCNQAKGEGSRMIIWRNYSFLTPDPRDLFQPSNLSRLIQSESYWRSGNSDIRRKHRVWPPFSCFAVMQPPALLPNASFYMDPPEEPPLSRAGFIVLSVIMAFFTIPAIVLNGTVIIVSLMHKQLRQPLNYALVNMAAADLGTAMTGGVMSVVNNAQGYFSLGRTGCVMEGFTVSFCGESKEWSSSGTAHLIWLVLSAFLSLQASHPCAQWLWLQWRGCLWCASLWDR